MADYLTATEHAAIQAFDNFHRALCAANDAMRALARAHGVPVADYFTVVCDKETSKTLFPPAEARERLAGIL